jgi:hypothetical protein
MTSTESIMMERERSKWTFRLAIIILAAFFAFYGLALLSGIFTSPDDYSGVEKVASTLGPIAAGVIGYYFGQRPVQSLTEQVQEVAIKKEKARVGLEETSEQTSELRGIANEQIQDLREQLRTKDEIITRLSKALEQQ